MNLDTTSVRELVLAGLSRWPHVLRHSNGVAHNLAIPDYNNPSDEQLVTNASEANVVTSAIAGEPGYHTLMLDLDVPARLVPSSTPGHSHLYVDVRMSTRNLNKVLDALADAGVVERNYAKASRVRGYTALRLPWVTKKADPWAVKPF